MKRKLTNRRLVFAALFIAAVAFIAPVSYNLAKDNADRPPARLNKDDTPLDRQNKTTVTSYAPMIDKVSPSVVNVFSTKVIKAPDRQQMPPMFNDPFFRRFFGDRLPNMPQQPQRDRREQGLGSGVIISANGYILTNSHVVHGADDVKIALSGSKKEYPATVIGEDPKTDIAVLKVDASDLPAVTVGNSDQLQVGDIVFAIGNPFGVGQTVTMGIVSAEGRGIGIVDYEDFIQTDAAINPGNSGGALIDAQGRLVGINTAILSRTGGNQGIGFAVPIKLATTIMEQIIEAGKVSRGFLGVTIQNIDPKLQKAFGLESSQGALVNEVHEDGAAAAAGVKNGDVIVKFNGKPVEDVRQLRFLVAGTPPGTKVTFTVIRDGKTKELSAQLGEFPSAATLAGGPDTPSADVFKGVTLEPMSPQLRQQLQAPSDLNGLVVTELAGDSKAAEAGLQQGDTIVEINRQEVASINDARQALRQSQNSNVLLYVWRQGQKLYLVLNP